MAVVGQVGISTKAVAFSMLGSIKNITTNINEVLVGFTRCRPCGAFGNGVAWAFTENTVIGLAFDVVGIQASSGPTGS